MATFSNRLLALFVVTFIVSCLATQTVWEFQLQGKASAKSRFYVLNNWNEKGGAYNPADSTPFPALQTSDIMLKTMGILRTSATWTGVKLGHLFQRPKATALFLIDGLSDSVSLDSLSVQSYNVDQTGLTGLDGYDSDAIFQGDSVLEHFTRLFNQQSLSMYVSQNGDSKVNLESFPGGFDLTSNVDKQFAENILAIKDSIKKLSSAAVTDSAPDVYVFSFSSLRALETKYTANSQQMKIALKIVTETIQEVAEELKKLYNENIVIQALVLQWTYPKLNKDQISGIRTVIESFDFSKSEIETMMKDLPFVTIPERLTSQERSNLCSSLTFFIELENGKLNAEPDCYSTNIINSRRIRRSVDESYDSPMGDLPAGNNTYHFGTVNGLVQERSENFPAIFLIIFVTIVPMALSLFAISWAMWNMDPGTDSVIYRNTDPVGIKLE